MSQTLLALFSVLSWIATAVGQTNDTDGFKSDPYLQYKPEFARSLPVQILVTGVVLTLVAVLFIHIVFTGQYHWPLAPVNYILQLSGVVTLLISLIATLHVVLSQTLTESARWPYMLSYIAVNVPPLDLEVNNPSDDTTNGNSWNLAERATWLIMNATVSGLVQITHIQFLTLLYPSQLEGRLIFSLLGPLAILAAVVQLIPISQGSSLITVANDIRNVCNATLSLLFTTSLFVWGLLVNRGQAWRTDGGTAVFGVSALSLAMVSTALNFLYVPKNEEYVWLPGLMWAVVLWQSFLGWWWWVGAGSGHTTDDVVEEVIRRGEKMARRRKQTRQRRLEARRAKKNRTVVDQDQDQEEDMSSEQEQDTAGRRSSLSGSETPTHGSSPRSSEGGTNTGIATSSSTTSFASDTTINFPSFLPKVVQAWYLNLRQAHVTAARRQTVERVERIREIERERMESQNNRRARSGVSGLGWGLGSFGLRMGRTDAELFEMETNPRRRRRPSEEPRTSSSDDGCFSDDHRSTPRSNTPAPRPKKRSKADAQRTVPPNDRMGADGAIGGRRRSMWWWGPFERWRLQDSTVY